MLGILLEWCAGFLSLVFLAWYFIPLPGCCGVVRFCTRRSGHFDVGQTKCRCDDDDYYCYCYCYCYYYYYYYYMASNLIAMASAMSWSASRTFNQCDCGTLLESRLLTPLFEFAVLFLCNAASQNALLWRYFSIIFARSDSH